MKTLVSIGCGVLLACCAFFFGTLSATRAQSPSASAPTLPPPVPPAKAAEMQSAFFPLLDQSTAVWQGCGPAQNQGIFEDFSIGHPHARIVQVFIDASVACRNPGAHTYVIVYQAARTAIRPAKAR